MGLKVRLVKATIQEARFRRGEGTCDDTVGVSEEGYKVRWVVVCGTRGKSLDLGLGLGWRSSAKGKA